jgi:hypothetical protein
MSSSPLIQISLLRRINNVFASIYDPLHLISRYSDNRRLSMLRASTMISLARETRGRARPYPRDTNAFLCRQKKPAFVENYPSDLHQVMILRLSRVGRTSCEQIVGHGCVHFIFFQNIIPLCVKN